MILLLQGVAVARWRNGGIAWRPALSRNRDQITLARFETTAIFRPAIVSPSIRSVDTATSSQSLGVTYAIWTEKSLAWINREDGRCHDRPMQVLGGV